MIGLRIGLNSGFDLTLLVIALRSKDAETTGHLSGALAGRPGWVR